MRAGHSIIAILIAASFAQFADAETVKGPIRVIDGDGIAIGEVKIRLFGIDAVEIGQTCTTEQGTIWDCGTWVADQVRATFQGKIARCTRQDTDRYSRMVATCEVAGQDMGEMIVGRGWALAYSQYSPRYELIEKTAALNDLGLWASRFQRPAQHRATRAKGRIPPDPACKIKGNITANGKIFHQPHNRDYERVGIRQERGERWFCTVSDAKRAGWRAARN